MSDGDLPSAGRIASIIDFVQAANALKDTLRSGFTAEGRSESAAEHTWRLALLVIMFSRDMPGIDTERLLKLCVIHDLGEAITGDTPAIHQTPGQDRSMREREGMTDLCEKLPGDLADEILALWDEYAAAKTPEAVMAKGFDKIETMLTHIAGKNPDDFDYVFNLDYGTTATGRHPLLGKIRKQVDAMTKKRAVDNSDK